MKSTLTIRAVSGSLAMPTLAVTHLNPTDREEHEQS